MSLVRPMVRSDLGELKGMDVEEGPEEAGVEKTPEEIFFEGVKDESLGAVWRRQKWCGGRLESRCGCGGDRGVGNLPAVRRGRRPDCCRPTLSNKSF